MKVKLLQNIEQGGQLKVNRHRIGPLNQAVGLAIAGVVPPETAKVLIDHARAQVVETPFLKDAIIDMSDATAKKYIDAGMAEAYVEPAAEASS